MGVGGGFRPTPGGGGGSGIVIGTDVNNSGDAIPLDGTLIHPRGTTPIQCSKETKLKADLAMTLIRTGAAGAGWSIGAIIVVAMTDGAGNFYFADNTYQTSRPHDPILPNKVYYDFVGWTGMFDIGGGGGSDPPLGIPLFLCAEISATSDPGIAPAPNMGCGSMYWTFIADGPIS